MIKWGNITISAKDDEKIEKICINSECRTINKSSIYDTYKFNSLNIGSRTFAVKVYDNDGVMVEKSVYCSNSAPVISSAYCSSGKLFIKASDDYRLSKICSNGSCITIPNDVTSIDSSYDFGYSLSGKYTVNVYDSNESIKSIDVTCRKGS